MTFKFVYLLAIGIVVALCGIALQLAYSVGDTLTPRDFVAFLVTLVGAGLGAVGYFNRDFELSAPDK